MLVLLTNTEFCTEPEIVYIFVPVCNLTCISLLQPLSQHSKKADLWQQIPWTSQSILIRMVALLQRVTAALVKSFLQGVSKLDLLVSHSDYSEGRYSLNITYGEVVYVGANLNISLEVGDTLGSSPFITSSNIRVHNETSVSILLIIHIFFQKEIFFDSGMELTNYYDNKVNEKDEVMFYLEAFVSNDGMALSSQVCT